MSELVVFDYKKGSRKAYNEAIKYWSDADGRLKRQDRRTITEDNLPEQLKQAYRKFVLKKNDDDLHYLVETKKGYGVAVVFEYDRWTAANSGLRCDEFAFPYMFSCLVLDAKKIADDPLFQNTEIFVTEYLGYDGCHELIIVFPSEISKKEFDSTVRELRNIAYESCFEEYNPPKKMAEAARVLKDVREGRHSGINADKAVVDEVLADATKRSNPANGNGHRLHEFIRE